MKLNIVRAWKDEVYRQSLSNEQMGTLPANPVGDLELTDTSLQFIYGGGGGGGGGGVAPRVAPGVGVFPRRQHGAAAAASGSSNAHTFEHSFHSLSLENCNERAFSLTFNGGFSFLSPVNAFCIDDED